MLFEVSPLVKGWCSVGMDDHTNAIAWPIGKEIADACQEEVVLFRGQYAHHGAVQP